MQAILDAYNGLDELLRAFSSGQKLLKILVEIHSKDNNIRARNSTNPSSLYFAI